MACLETHLPKALRLFLLVPYLAANAAGSALRSALHAFAALTSALTSSSTVLAVLDFAFCETHLPCALAPCLPVPYFAAKAAGSAVSSAVQSLEAFGFASWWPRWSRACAWTTHLPNALRWFLFVP